MSKNDPKRAPIQSTNPSSNPSTTPATKPSVHPSIVVEIAHFGVKAGTDREAVLAAAQKSQTYLERCEGFLSRRLCEPTDTEPRWVDILEWRDMTSAKQAAAGLGGSKDCAPLMAIIEEKTVGMQHPVGHHFG